MSQTDDQSRRLFLKAVGATTGAVALAPLLGACQRQAGGEPTTPQGGEVPPATEPAVAAADPMAIPATRPEGWDPIAFNRDRGNAGAIPESYREAINGDNGPQGALGKHLPYVPSVEGVEVPEGFLPLMFGDASLGNARHPVVAPLDDGTGGHYYNWIRLRKAVEGEAEEREVRFSSWPEPGEGDPGRFAAQGGGDITAENGVNTIYLVPLPADVGPGDQLRVTGHCTLHGEYVDFVTIPA